ncbi:MAG TPA: hypothetical protein ENK52_06585 [Saprospiraceae bacterium]|nr:hypothetical protein [Saprospiraceae bacterium]
MQIWNFILSNLKNNIKVTLLYVVDSKGSSPGRKGFVMAVNERAVFEGTIGGGIMEVKMIELAKSKFKKGNTKPIIKKQFHNKSEQRNQSGLICSGEQTLVIFPFKKADIEIVEHIVNRKEDLYLLMGSQTPLQISQEQKTEKIQIYSEEDFECIINVKKPKTIHIFGAGHVGLALAQQMYLLCYKIIQYDERPEVFTISKNKFAHEIKVIDFQNIEKNMEADSSDIVVIVSTSYRTDKIILKQLYYKKFAYIGMMGSDHKIASLKKELLAEGISNKEIDHIFMPIGLEIYSKTAAEIAVSIAAQIIYKTNKNLPTGRKY